MARNRDNTLANKHKGFFGSSGRGKTYAIKTDPAFHQAQRVIAFDPYGDHQVTHYDKMHDLYRSAVEHWKSGKPFRIGFSGSNTEENAQAVGWLVWTLSSGDKPIYFLLEETGTAFANPGSLKGALGECVRAGRSYAIEMILSAQQTTDVPKTLTGNIAQKWLFGQDEPIHAERVAKSLGLKQGDIQQMKIGEYYLVQQGIPGHELKRTPAPKK